MIRISNLTLGIVDINTYFIENEEDVILTDPPSESQKIVKKLNQINKSLKVILLTHTHYDHIGTSDNIIEKHQVPIYMSKNEFDFLADPDKNGSSKFTQYDLSKIEDHANPLSLSEGPAEVEGFKFKVLYTPDHSPGSLSFVFNDFAAVGGILFKNGIGRTDPCKGDYETLIDSIKDKLLELEGDVSLFPGCGPYTTVDDE